MPGLHVAVRLPDITNGWGHSCSSQLLSGALTPVH